MSNNRKIQGEIDRLLKKTEESLESYDQMYEKYQGTGSQAMRERFDALKKEIKKVQRLREQIKLFIANSEVKDKKSLESLQKKIEDRMGDFREFERQMKMKAFSKEGLAANADNVSPQASTEAWLKEAIDSCRKKIEILEYEVQRVNNGSNRVSRKSKQQQKSGDQIRLEKLKAHFYKWEQLMRMVNNQEVEPDEVDDLKENVLMILNSDTTSDSIDNSEMYDGFDIPEMKARNSGEEEEEEEVQGSSRNANNTPNPGSLSSKSNPKKTPLDSAMGKNSVEASGSKRGSQSGKLNEAHPSDSVGSDDQDAENPEWLDDEMDAANDDTFGDDAMNTDGQGTLADMAQATMAIASIGDWEKGKPTSLAKQKVSSSPQKTSSDGAGDAKVSASPVATEPAAAKISATPSTPSAESRRVASNAPPSQHSDPTHLDENATLRLLDMSLANLPHTFDLERHRPYEPPNAINEIPYFPQEVLPALASEAIYHQFDLDTLFFIFYYHQKSHHQYFAAKQLKKYSYRYHTENKKWYQRLRHPSDARETSERGSYCYFDYENKWAHEEVQDFLFEYKYLEKELE